MSKDSFDLQIPFGVLLKIKSSDFKFLFVTLKCILCWNLPTDLKGAQVKHPWPEDYEARKQLRVFVPGHLLHGHPQHIRSRESQGECLHNKWLQHSQHGLWKLLHANRDSNGLVSTSSDWEPRPSKDKEWVTKLNQSAQDGWTNSGSWCCTSKEDHVRMEITQSTCRENEVIGFRSLKSVVATLIGFEDAFWEGQLGDLPLGIPDRNLIYWMSSTLKKLISWKCQENRP